MLHPSVEHHITTRTLTGHRLARRGLRTSTVGYGLLLLIIVSVAATGCGQDTNAAQVPGATSTHASPDTPFFPRQQGYSGPRTGMSALLTGELVVHDGCLQVISREPDETYTPVWPSDFSLSAAGDEIQILDGSGRVVLRVGEEVRLGGGEARSLTNIPAVDEQLQKELSSKCPSPYWLVGDIPR